MKSNPLTPEKKHRHSIRLLAEAITYRTPLPVTKVILYNHDNPYPVCPRCARSMEREYMSFCDRCGQKLNWDLFEHATICRPGYLRD